MSTRNCYLEMSEPGGEIPHLQFEGVITLNLPLCLSQPRQTALEGAKECSSTVGMTEYR